jgi:hypothetical protein
MRRLFMASALLMVLSATPGVAEDYPWCVIEPAHGPSPECNFTSLEQCRGSSAGAGGGANCSRNPFYKEPAPVVQSSPPPAPLTTTAAKSKPKKRQTTTSQTAPN